MRHDTSTLMEAIRERRLRAVDVRHRYHIEFAGMKCYVVTEPEDFERSYLVNLLDKSCTCPDWQCQEDKDGENHGCKHLFAVAELTGAKTGDSFERRASENLAYAAKQKIVVDAKLDDEVYPELTPAEKKQFADAMAAWAMKQPAADLFGD